MVEILHSVQDDRKTTFARGSLVFRFIVKGYFLDRSLKAGIGDTVFFKLHDDFFSQRRTYFGYDLKNCVRSYPIIVLRNQFLFKGELSNLLEEIFHISWCKSSCHLYDTIKVYFPGVEF
jgi:hypothetical protein